MGDYETGKRYRYADINRLIEDLNYWYREKSADDIFSEDNPFYTEVNIYFYADGTFEVSKHPDAETNRTDNGLKYYDTSEGIKVPYFNDKLVIGYGHTHKGSMEPSSDGEDTDQTSRINGIDNYIFYRGEFHKY